MEEFKTQLTETFTTKFDRLEQVIAAMAAPLRVPDNPGRDENITGQGVHGTTQAEIHDHRQEHLSPPQTASNPRPLSFIETNIPVQSQRPVAGGTLADKGFPATSQAHIEAPATLTSDNNNGTSPAWIISQALASNSNVPVPTAGTSLPGTVN